jgi:2-methylisocitrate lyase-like PEP mutase family enzyme
LSGVTTESTNPLNVLAGPGAPSRSELASLGVRRVSVGSGPARAVMDLVRKIGRELLDEGTYASISEGAIPYPEANRIFSGE